MKELTKKRYPLSFLKEIILFLTFAIIMVFGFGGLADVTAKIIENPIGVNVADKYIFALQMIILILYLFIGVMFMFCVWSVYNYNRIKKEIAYTQESIIKGQNNK